MAETGQQVVSIQGLRALAAMMVVAHHITWWLNNSGIPLNHDGSLSIGVDIFFVISGYVMFMLTERREVAAPVFLWRRLSRIAPPYWAFTAIAAVPFLMASGGGERVASSLLFLPTFGPDGGAVLPLLSVGWTLSYEMYFYAIVSVSLLLPWRRPIVRLMAVAGVMTTIWLCDGLTGGANRLLHWYAAPIVFQFVIGGLLRLYQPLISTVSTKATASAAILAGLGLVAFLFPYGQHHGAAQWTAAATLICAGFILSEECLDWSRWPFVTTLGDASYMLYLLHWVVGNSLAKGLSALSSSGALPAWVLAAAFSGMTVTLSVAGSVYLHRRFESPATNWLNGLLVTLSTRPSSSTATP